MNLACNLACLCLAAGLVSSRAELIPADRLVPWTPGQTVGVVGGIPANRTNLINVALAPYNADTNGIVNAQSAIQSAITAASSNDVVYLPAGTYLLSGGLSGKSYTTIRGAGMSNVTVNFTGAFGYAILLGSDSHFDWSYPAAPDDVLVSGYTKGSSNLVVTLTTDPSWVGQQVLLREKLNDPALPVLNTVGYLMNRKHLARITAQSGTSITIWPPLPWTMQASLEPKYNVGVTSANYAGIEDLTINASTSTSPSAHVGMIQAYSCWFKNVKVTLCKNYAFGVGDSSNFEMRGCWADRSVDGPVSNHAGLIVGESSDGLIEDNIIDDIFPCIEVNAGVTSTVFGYNFIALSVFAGALNLNHGPHNSYILCEGNVTFSVQSDGYFGSASELTLFRNWVHGIYVGGGGAGTASGYTVLNLNRFTRNASMVGNLFGNSVSNITFTGNLALGKPNIGNFDWSGYGPPWTMTNKESSPITFTQSGNTLTASAPIFSATNVNYFALDRTASHVGTSLGQVASVASSLLADVNVSQTQASAHLFDLSPGPAGWQQIDTNVAFTAVFKGNYYYPQESPTRQPLVTDAIANPVNPDTALGGDTVPSSLYYTAQPTFLSGYNWPPVNYLSPASGGLATNLLIPAMTRYFGGTPPPPTPPGIPPVVIGGAKIRGGVNLRVYQ